MADSTHIVDSQRAAGSPLPGAVDELTPRAAQAEMKRRQDASLIIRLLKPVSSMRLTVVLFALAMVIVLAGTLAQIDKGIQTVMKEYFRTAIAWIDIAIFFPRSWNLHFTFPFPGGFIIGGLMLLNLIAAHAVRFTVKATGVRLGRGLIVLLVGLALVAGLIGQVHHRVHLLQDFYWELLLVTVVTCVLWWACSLLFNKRSGIVLLHGGITFMLVSEGITAWYQVENNMSILQRGATNYVESITENELAFVDTTDKEHHNEVVIRESLLAHPPREIKDDKLPFDVLVTKFMRNSRLVDVPEGSKDVPGPLIDIIAPATKQKVATAKVVEKPEGTGVSADQRIDIAAVDVTLKDKKTGKDIGTYRLSLWHDLHEQPLMLDVNGKPMRIELRHARTYKPYTVTLLEFKHETYLGTDTPRNFSSRVRLIDPAHNVDREALIWMNHPLRYGGETFFQSAFMPGDTGTVLQVVANPGRIIPYLSCMMVAIGLLAHFITHLLNFIDKTAAQRSHA